jgi:protein TonB
MRWSFWPVSITLHVCLGVAVLIVPLVAEVAAPPPAPLHPMLISTTKVVPVPDSVIAAAPRVPEAPVLPSVTAPFTLAREPDSPAGPTGPPIPGMPEGPGNLEPSFLGTSLGSVVTPPVLAPEPKPAQTILRVGQGVREPRRVSGPMPEYPAIARSARVEGVVILEAVIDERGEVGRIKVLKSIPLLDGAATAAVEQWRYTPTLLNGVPVSVLMSITVRFTLQN